MRPEAHPQQAPESQHHLAVPPGPAQGQHHLAAPPQPLQRRLLDSAAPGHQLTSAAEAHLRVAPQGSLAIGHRFQHELASQTFQPRAGHADGPMDRNDPDASLKTPSSEGDANAPPEKAGACIS